MRIQEIYRVVEIFNDLLVRPAALSVFFYGLGRQIGNFHNIFDHLSLAFRVKVE